MPWVAPKKMKAPESGIDDGEQRAEGEQERGQLSSTAIPAWPASRRVPLRRVMRLGGFHDALENLRDFEYRAIADVRNASAKFVRADG